MTPGRPTVRARLSRRPQTRCSARPSRARVGGHGHEAHARGHGRPEPSHDEGAARRLPSSPDTHACHGPAPEPLGPGTLPGPLRGVPDTPRGRTQLRPHFTKRTPTELRASTVPFPGFVTCYRGTTAVSAQSPRGSRGPGQLCPGRRKQPPRCSTYPRTPWGTAPPPAARTWSAATRCRPQTHEDIRCRSLGHRGRKPSAGHGHTPNVKDGTHRVFPPAAALEQVGVTQALMTPSCRATRTVRPRGC